MKQDNAILKSIIGSATTYVRADINSGILPKDILKTYSEDRLLCLHAQYVLSCEGYFIGKLDGLYGNRTDAAVNMWVHYDKITKKYGKAGSSQCTGGVVIPKFPIFVAWGSKTKLSKILCHEEVAASCQKAYDLIAARYTPQEIVAHGFNLFGGCYNNRNKRGSNLLSMHAYGIAIDHDPERNQLKWGRDKAYLAKVACKPFLDAWEDCGWISLGRAQNYDWMHVEVKI